MKNGAKSVAEAMDAIQWDANGLVPAIVQDAISKQVLMLAYMNREALKLSVESGQTWFWSRSRSELWHKGATTGHVQDIRSIYYDCDADTLLIEVIQTGPACHTGTYSCFQREISMDGDESKLESGSDSQSEQQTAVSSRFAILSKLEEVVASRDAERPEGAYTTYLFEKGLDKILKKVGEETAEVIIAAKNRDNDELRYEISDLIFHVMVLMRDAKLPLDEVMRELGQRHVQK